MHFGLVLNAQPASWVVRQIWRAWERGLPPQMEKPEHSMLQAKTEGKKCASEPGVTCLPCLEYLWV